MTAHQLIWTVQISQQQHLVNMRRYFIMDITQAQSVDVEEAKQMALGLVVSHRYSLDNSKVFIKTTQSEIDAMLERWQNQYTWEQIMELTFTTEYTLEEVKTILNGLEWTNPDELI